MIRGKGIETLHFWDHDKPFIVLGELHHDFCAGKVERDDPETWYSQDFEGKEVLDLQLVSYGEAGPPFIRGKPPVDIPELDSLVAADVPS